MLEDSIKERSKMTQVLVCRGAWLDRRLCNVSRSLLIKNVFPSNNVYMHVSNVLSVDLVCNLI